MVNTEKQNDRRKAAEKFEKLLEIMASLRGEGGCEWDKAQNHHTLRPYMIEEATEAVDAIGREDWEGLAEELGDVLLQVVFHARMAEEESRFSVDEVLDAIIDKMIQRHPHVFGGESAPNAEEALASWNKRKREEKNNKAGGMKTTTSVLNDVPIALPALMRAQRFGEKAAPVGFDWPTPEGVVEKIDEEIGELKSAVTAKDKANAYEELGDTLFVLSQLARKLNLDAEQALSDTNRKFQRRFEAMEKLALEKFNCLELPLEQWDALWAEVKVMERSKAK